MGKLFCLMGKSSSGKDTIYRLLKEDKSLGLMGVTSYTTRPIRDGEIPDEWYHFVDEGKLLELSNQGLVIEQRTYNTVHGPWHYFLVDDGQIDFEKGDYLVIGTIESYVSQKSYFGADKVVPIYVEVEDGLRLERALSRERMQEAPKYAEMCRRFLADCEDFSEEKIKDADIKIRFINDDLESTVARIGEYIRGNKG